MKKFSKNLVTFARRYKKFSFVLVMAAVGIGLQIGGLATAAHWVLGGTAIILAVPMLIDMIRDLRMGTYGVDVLAITAIVTAVIMREYWAAIVIVLMLTGGEALEDYAENRAKREMTALLSNAPRRAHVIRGQKEVDVSVSSVKMGDKIVIRPGEVVPVDAVILDGSANFDESSLTGESLPEEKTVGTELLSGAINVDGTVTAKAVRAVSESQYEQIVKLVRNAAASRAPFVRMADADLPEGMMVYVELLDSEGNTVGDNTYLITPDSNGQVVLDGLDPSVVRSVSFAYYHPNYPEQFMSELQTEEVAYECWAKEVTPIAPTATTVCGANNDAMALPEIDGVTYSLVGWINGVLHVTATANDGYMFPEGVTTSWTFNDANTTCPQVLGDTTVAPSLPAPKLEDTGTNPIVVLMVSLTTIGTAVGVMLRRKQFADEVN